MRNQLHCSETHTHTHTQVAQLRGVSPLNKIAPVAQALYTVQNPTLGHALLQAHPQRHSSAHNRKLLDSRDRSLLRHPNSTLLIRYYVLHSQCIRLQC
jgi:hypothetical protein